jgi:hypothetical protein
MSLRFYLCLVGLCLVQALHAQTDTTPKANKPFPFNILYKMQQGQLKFVPVPLFSISPERGASFGMVGNYFFKASKDSATRTSYAFINLQYSTRNQFVSEVGYSIFSKKEQYYFEGRVGFRDFYERYWTLSNANTSNDVYLGMEYKLYSFRGRALKHLSNQFFAGLAYHVSSYNNIEFEQKPFPSIPTNVPGYTKSFVVGIGPAIIIDKRDNQFSPQQGHYVEASYRIHQTWMGGAYNYGQGNIDLRKYLPTKTNGLLALNAVATITNGTVPLLERQRLGSDKIMRGYFTGRFRDNEFAAAQMEFRQHLTKTFVLAAFASVGQTGNNLNEMSLTNMQHSVGGGFRYLINKKDRLYVRIDAGYTRQQNVGFYLALGDAF